jgi:hypothetical protein
VSASFYCIADSRYFLGAVGLVNSLRLVGHREPVVLLDCGLTAEQRALLEPEAAIVPAPADAPPTMLKTIAPLDRPDDVMVLIDTDMIATRRLGEPMDAARAGKAVAFRNDTERFVPEWGELLGLGRLERHPYLSFGMLAIGGERGLALLRELDELQGRVDFDRTYWRERRVTDYEFLYADQDVLNALLAARFAPEDILALDQRLAPLPPFGGLEIVDVRSLRCAHRDGTAPFVVHHWLTKPWLEPTHDGVYSRLLRRLLAADDVAIRVPPGDVPLWLRRGVRAFAERKRINTRERLRAGR